MCVSLFFYYGKAVLFKMKLCWDRVCSLRYLICLLFIFSLSDSLLAQKVHLSTNMLGYANFGTINGEIGLCLSQHFSLYLQGKYNPFEYESKVGKQMNNRQLSIAFGTKYWLWHTCSGWFLSGQCGWMRYNCGGIFTEAAYEGDACGVTFGAGYALMLNRHWNIDFGVGVMAGYTDYIKYSCPSCGKIVGNGEKIFFAPNNILLQMTYLF